VDIDLAVELTELEKLEVTRVDAVGRPANGFPALIMKGTALAQEPAAKAEEPALGIAVKAVTGGEIDQGPDISLGHQIMGLLAQAIQAEAQEIGAGSYGETCDVDLLNCAASMIARWLGREAPPGDDGGMMLMQSAAKALEWTDEQWEACAALLKDSREFSADERKKHAAEGNALPDGSYPIPDEDALRRAAILARSGHGDVTAAKTLIARRARELGVANPLDDSKDDAAKGQIAKGDATVDTGAQGTGDLAKVVEDAVTKALQPHKERVTALEAELAKVKATPVPGGPVLSRNVQVKTPQGAVSEDWAAKAARYRELAEQVTDRTTADGYRKLARDADAKAVAPATT